MAARRELTPPPIATDEMENVGTGIRILLVAELAPKVIGAGKPVVDIWLSAGGIIAAAVVGVQIEIDTIPGRSGHARPMLRISFRLGPPRGRWRVTYR